MLMYKVLSKYFSLTLFQSEDGRIILYVCDFFDITREMMGDLDCIFDRGSLVAIYPKDREAYVSKMAEILQGNTKKWKYLLATYDYDQSVYPGPPRSVPKELVHKLYGEISLVLNHVLIPLMYRRPIPANFHEVLHCENYRFDVVSQKYCSYFKIS